LNLLILLIQLLFNTSNRKWSSINSKSKT